MPFFGERPCREWRERPQRVLRGGSWINDNPTNLSCAYRNNDNPDNLHLFGDDPARLWELRAGIVRQLAAVRLKLAEPKSRLLATREGVPFCGFRFLPGLRPRGLGGTKRRFERRRYVCYARGGLVRLSQVVFAWYQFSREGSTEGLWRAYAHWPLAARLKQRRPSPSGGRGPALPRNRTSL